MRAVKLVIFVPTTLALADVLVGGDELG